MHAVGFQGDFSKLLRKWLLPEIDFVGHQNYLKCNVLIHECHCYFFLNYNSSLCTIHPIAKYPQAKPCTQEHARAAPN